MRIKRLLGLKDNPAIPKFAAFMILTLMITAATVSIGTLAHAQPAATLQTTHAQASALPYVGSTTLLTRSVASGPNPATQDENKNTSDAPALPDTYQNWLNQDVRWNITPTERDAFLQLSDNTERDQFIEQFWLRRDPPGSSPYTFRAEHYRRIAYANQHFSGSVPGWKTDRGRIFILYGRPTGIDAHPAADESFETWGYKDAPGLGQNVELKFVDVCKCGNYQLQQQPISSVHEINQPDKVLYEKGLDEIKHERYESARLALQTMINSYPDSQFARSAQLAIAASWDEQGGPSALVEANRGYENAKVTPSSIGGGVSAPVVTYSVPPEYSVSAKQAKIQGSVLINLWVDEQGLPSHLRVIRGVGKGLDEKAIQAVRQYKFKPAMQSGKPVLVALNVEVNFAMF